MSYRFNPLTGDLYQINEEVDVGQIEVASLSLKATAGQTISALRAVNYNASNELVYAQPNGTFGQALPIGVSFTAGNQGDLITVVTQGDIDDAYFSTFSREESIYLGLDGELTQVPPTSGFVVVIGTYLGNNRIKIEINTPIVL